jgi:hypothetical protein
VAARRARSFGAASVAGLVLAAADRGSEVSEADVRAALALDSGAAFLDADWFWLPGGRRSRLETLSRRMLAVASPLDVVSMRAGACRAFPRREAELVPPAEVTGAFYDAHPAFVLDPPGQVRSVAPLDWRTELGETDRVFVEVLRSSWTGVLDHDSFRDACVAKGMTTRTFGVRTARSEVLDNPAADIWCLRGTRVSPITAAALRHAKAVGEA